MKQSFEVGEKVRIVRGDRKGKVAEVVDWSGGAYYEGMYEVKFPDSRLTKSYKESSLQPVMGFSELAEPEIKEKKKLDYPATEKFRVMETIPVPHPYCITPKHLQYGGGMYLDVEGAERRSREAHPNDSRRWAVCDICRKRNRKTGEPILSFSEHKSALLVEVNDPRELKDIPELKKYLLRIKAQAEKEGYAGFAFKQKGA